MAIAPVSKTGVCLQTRGFESRPFRQSMIERRTRLIEYDADGTLVKSLGLWVAACKYYLAELSLEVSDEEVARQFICDLNRISHYLTSNKDISVFINNVVAHAFEQALTIPLNDGVQETLNYVHSKGVKQAVVTSAKRSFVMKLLRYHKLPIDYVVSRDDVPRGETKPHPTPLLRATRALNVSPTQAWMIGDSEADILGGKNAGIPVAWYFPKEHDEFYDEQRMLLHQPDQVIRHFSEVAKLIDRPPRGGILPDSYETRKASKDANTR